MNSRSVYETGRGRLCPTCGWPVADCRCSSAVQARPEPIPARVTARLRLEKRGAGKAVTVVHGLPRNAGFLRELSKELKKACGTGGALGEDFVELQGDQRERLRDLLATKGWTVKG